MSQQTLAVYKVSPDHLYSEVGSEAVILDLESGVYYGLNETGVRIWEWLQEPKAFAELHELMMNEYEVDSQQCESDLKKILAGMTEAGILELSGSI